MRVCIQLFGRLNLHSNGEPLKGLEPHGVQELLCYLVLSRNRPLRREEIADALWGEIPTARSLKALRQNLWLLKQVWPDNTGLLCEDEWLRLNLTDDAVDVAQLEAAYQNLADRPAQNLSPAEADQLNRAVNLYHDDLLSGWQQEWCIWHRERLQNQYLMLLDKLLEYSVLQGHVAQGLGYAQRILLLDPCNERTHRQVMHLYYRSDQRTLALRQYQRCCEALKNEMDVAPSKSTQDLYRIIATEPGVVAQPQAVPFSTDGTNPTNLAPTAGQQLGELVVQLQTLLSSLQQLLRRAEG